MNPVVIVAAILPLGPLVAGGDPTQGPGLVVALASWVVFAIDFAVRTRLDDAFLRTWKGRLYLGIVVVTFPVYVLVPGLEEADLLVVSRLGWVAVLAISGIESVRDARVLVADTRTGRRTDLPSGQRRPRLHRRLRHLLGGTAHSSRDANDRESAHPTWLTDRARTRSADRRPGALARLSLAS